MTISATERLDIIKLVVGTFNAAPGETYLNELVPIVDNGGSMLDVATALTQTDVYKSSAFYPLFLTSEEWANRFADNVLNNATLAASEREWAIDWMVGQLNAGATQAEIIVAAINALDAIPHDDPVWGDAAAAFDNRATVAEYYSVDAAGTATDIATLQGVIADVDSSEGSVEDAIDVIDNGPPVAGTTFNLTVESAAGADVMRLTGDMDARIDVTADDNQVKGLDLNGNGVIELNGVENNNPTDLDDGIDFEIVDAQSRNLLNQGDTSQNFLGDISFDGTGNAGDGVDTNGNIFLGGLGVDRASGGIGNDFMSGGGVRADRFEFQIVDGGGFLIDTETGKAAGTTEDYLFGGRNADFFFASLSALDFTDGDTLDIDGGETADDSAAGEQHSKMDSDWLLIEASDDDEPVVITLAESGQQGSIWTPFMQDLGGNIDTGDANDGIDIANLEHVDASGNLYGFLDDMDVALGENGMMVDGENVGIGSSAQLRIIGNSANNILIGGYDNDHIHGGEGDDLLMGGNLHYALNNPNAAGIVNDGMDELIGGAGNDNIVFEADGGIIRGDDGSDTLWLTDQSLGTVAPADADTVTKDGVLRFELENGDEGDGNNWWAGTGGADVEGTADQTNYKSSGMRVDVEGMDSIIATGLGAVDYLAAGTNDPELVFRNQQNHFAYNGDLDLRGHDGKNVLYAAGGDDVIEGREGNDMLSGGNGRDDFYFSLGSFGGAGDGVDVIHRQEDDGNNLWTGKYVQDFGIGRTEEEGTSYLYVDFTGSDLALPGVAVAIFNVTVDGELLEGGDTDTLSGFDSVDDLAAHLNDVFSAQDPTVSVTSDGEVVIVQKAGGGEFGTTIDTGTIIAGTATNGPLETHITTDAIGPTVTPDRLIYAAYEDRSDNELVDDDSVLGSTISLGANNYAQDLVVNFADDGTRIAERQKYAITFNNLTTQDVVTIKVNGVEYSLQVGVDLDGNIVAAEDGLGENQLQIQANFLGRLRDYINSFNDVHTAAGQVSAALAGSTLSLTQVNYNGEETVFMTTPVVTIDNLSGGEAAKRTIVNQSSHEVHLLDFDGRDGNLNEDSVLFWGTEKISRAILATAEDAGGELLGSDAVVIDGGANDLVDEPVGSSLVPFNNQATNAPLNVNFSVHGDDLLLGGIGDDEISAGTGDDRVIGSAGTDEVDGGKNIYRVQVLGEAKARVYVANAWEASSAANLKSVLPELAGLTISSISVIPQSESGTGTASGVFSDTLQFQQADFGPDARFTITLDDFSVVGAGIGGKVEFRNDGAGTVGTDEDGDGVIDHLTMFTNFENIRTVSGTGRADADGGQGRDTLNVAALSSSDATGGVSYNLTNDGGAGEVRYSENATAAPVVPGAPVPVPGDYEVLAIRVDGVENVISGTGNDLLLIDETEANKDNVFQAGLGTDRIIYRNQYSPVPATDAIAQPTVTIAVNSASDTDTVTMTAGRNGSTVATDTLVGVERISLENGTAEGSRENDVLDVTAMTSGAVVDYNNGEVRTSIVPGTGVELIIDGIARIENVWGDGNDTVVVANSNNMSGLNARSDAPGDAKDISFATFLDYDEIDANDKRIPFAEQTSAQITDTINEGQYRFELSKTGSGNDVDTVDYSYATDAIAVVVEQDAGEPTQRVLVDSSGGNFDAGVGLNDRVDVLVDVEQIVASQGESVLDFTGTSNVEIQFNNPDPTLQVAALDRDVSLVKISNISTAVPLDRGFVEYRDAGTSATVTQQTATWNRVEGGDGAERVIAASIQSTEDVVMNLRGGDNEVKYNELTRSIILNLGYGTFFDTNDGFRATVLFTDGTNPVPMPNSGTHFISSYAAGNAVAPGSMTIYASVDGEDALNFDAFNVVPKLFILGKVVGNDDEITVKLEGQEDSIILRGFEVLNDDPLTNDVYQMDDLVNIAANLVLNDGGLDHDTIKVTNQAALAAFNGGIPGNTTIDLAALNAVFTFDWDVLNIEDVNLATLTTVNGQNLADIWGDELVMGLINNVTNVNDFEALVLTDKTIGQAGTTFVLDTAANQLIAGAKTITFNNDMNVLSFNSTALDNPTAAPHATIGVSVTAVGPDAVTFWGGDGADTITGADGNDTLRGGGGDDTISGGFKPEVLSTLTFDLDFGTMGAGTATDILYIWNPGFGNGVFFWENGQVTDNFLNPIAGTGLTDGANRAVIGDAISSIGLADWNTYLGLPAGSVSNVSVSNNVVTFTFSAAYGDAAPALLEMDVVENADLTTLQVNGIALTGAGVAQAGNGDDYAARVESSDTYLFEATAAANGKDTLNSVDASDFLDFSAFTPAGAVMDAASPTNFAGGILLTGLESGVVAFNKGSLAASDIATGNTLTAGKVTLADNAVAVVVVSADADGNADATVNPWLAYYVWDSNDAVGASTWNVQLVGTINSDVELSAAAVDAMVVV